MSETKLARKGVLIAVGVICIVLASSLIATVAVYTSIIQGRDSAISSLNSQTASLNSQIANLKNQIEALQTQINDGLRNATDFILYYEEFGNVSLLGSSLNFTPPISMYRALIIALKSGGWTWATLSGMTVRASLEYWEFSSNSSSSSSEMLHYVTQPPKDYSPVQVNGTTYRYIWDIVVESSVGALSIPPPGLYWVDAATGELIPTPPLF